MGHDLQMRQAGVAQCLHLPEVCSGTASWRELYRQGQGLATGWRTCLLAERKDCAVAVG
jgi:hypothetical protein